MQRRIDVPNIVCEVFENLKWIAVFVMVKMIFSLQLEFVGLVGFVGFGGEKVSVKEGKLISCILMLAKLSHLFPICENFKTIQILFIFATQVFIKINVWKVNLKTNILSCLERKCFQAVSGSISTV